MFALNLFTSITSILNNFDFQVLNIEQRIPDLIITTDRGLKRLTYWNQVEQLRWSYLWREKLAEQGYRYVERFIHSRFGLPFVLVQWGGYTVSDYNEGDAFSLKQNYELDQLGQIHGRLHKAIQSTRGMMNPYLFYQSSLQRLRNIRVKMGLFDEQRWGQNRKAIVQRLEYAENWLRQGLIEGRQIPLSLPTFMPENLYRWGGEWYITGLMQVSPRSIHLDTAGLLRRIYRDRKGELGAVVAYLEGYRKVRPLTTKELHLLLSELIYPRELIRLAQQGEAKLQNRNQWDEMLEEGYAQQEIRDTLVEGVSKWSSTTIG